MTWRQLDLSVIRPGPALEMRHRDRSARLWAVTTQEFRERLEAVRMRVRRAAERAGRDASAVEILPVTKGHPAHYLRYAAESGLRMIGENRVGEAEEKRLLAGDLGLHWHMVGHLQRNKAARAVALFDVVESVDSLRLARRLHRETEREEKPVLEILVQVNTSGEPSKGGFSPEETPRAVTEICGFTRLRVAGLMTMAPLTDDEEVLRRTFRGVRELLARCADASERFEPRVLSMGMSNDFEIAVEEGSTRLRLGTTLFGERPE